MTDQPLGATVADRLSALLGGGVTGVRAVTGGRPAAYRATIGGDRHLLAKWWPDAPPGFFDAEARGLAWLGEAAPGLVPTVVAAADDLIAMEWLEQTAPTAAAAERLGRSLARLHHAGAPIFGAPWQGYIGPLPMDNRPLAGWPEFYAERRVVPYLRLAADRGSLARSDAAAVEEVLSRIAELAGPAEPPARLHGDLWSGNVLWTPGGARLIDPAAHGGHRESDLAMLSLFGAPLLDRALAAYQEERPLAGGWPARVPLHQLHPLLVHAALFGGGYGARAGQAARAALRS